MKNKYFEEVTMKGDNWRKIEIFSLALFGVSVGYDIIWMLILFELKVNFFIGIIQIPNDVFTKNFY